MYSHRFKSFRMVMSFFVYLHKYVAEYNEGIKTIDSYGFWRNKGIVVRSALGIKMLIKLIIMFAT